LSLVLLELGDVGDGGILSLSLVRSTWRIATSSRTVEMPRTMPTLQGVFVIGGTPAPVNLSPIWVQNRGLGPRFRPIRRP